MKGKDIRIVTIRGLDTNTNSLVDFRISLSDIAKTLRMLKEKHLKEVEFHIEKHLVPITYKNLKQIYVVGKKMYAKIEIPKILKEYVHDLSESSFAKCTESISARDEEIERAWTCLELDKKCNAILVGEPGVGKTTIAMEIVRSIAAKECPDDLQLKQVLLVDTLKLLELSEKSPFKYRYVLDYMYQFIQLNRNKIILYIDNLLHIKCEIDLAKYFRNFFKRSSVKILSSCSIEDFETYFIIDNELIKYMNPIIVDEPDVDELYPMLKEKIQAMQKEYDVSISEKMIRFAILTSYHLSSSFSANPESIVDTINFALADAKRKGQKEVKKENIVAYYYMDFKLAKKTVEIEREITAYHEAGHYIVAKMSNNIKDFKNAFVSIMPIEGALGLTASYDDKGKQLTYNKKYFVDSIAFDLGGRVGEALITNEFSSGASRDLAQANTTAENVIMSLGLSKDEEERYKSYIVGGYVKDYLLTDELRTKINNEISNLMSEAYKRAEQLINDHREEFDEIVKKLLEENILMGDELDEICEKYSKKSIS